MVGIPFNIKSMFDRSGINEAKKALDSLKGTSREMDMSAKELSTRMEGLGVMFDENLNDGMGGFRSEADGTITAFDDITGEMGALSAMSKQTGKDIDIVKNRIAQSRQELYETEQGVTKFRDEITGAMSESAEATSKVSNQINTFNEEALSALFAAMAVGRQMGELTDPAMEAAGVFDLINNTLELFFLPIALEVRDLVLSVRNALLSLSGDQKKIIGAIVLLISLLASIAVVAAGAILNLGGLKTVLYAASGAMGTLASAVAGGAKLIATGIYTALGPVGIIIAAIIGAVIAFKVAWDKNLGGIRQKVGRFVKWIGNNLPKIVKAVSPVIGVMDLLIKAVNRLFGKDIETLGEKFDKIGDGIANMGDEMIKSGNKFDEMKKKKEGMDKGFAQKFKPDVGAKTGSEPLGAANKEFNQTNKNVKNKFNIKTRKGQDPVEIAEEVSRVQKRSKDKTTREL